ncbi:MAG: RNA polymerase sigma factor [Phycisphaerales bacterium]
MGIPPVKPVVPTPSTADESVLVPALQRGEDAAFETLVRVYGGRMLAVAKRFLNDDSDAADAVQDAFISAHKSIGRFDGRSQLGTWLHRITVNASLMKLRSRKRRQERSIEDLLPRFKADGHQEMDSKRWHDAEFDKEASDAVRRLVRAKINELPEQYRTILLLRDIEGLDTDSTGAALGMTVAAVKTRLHRARQALRTLLDPHMRGDE